MEGWRTHLLRCLAAALLAAALFALGFLRTTSQAERNWQFLAAGLASADNWSSYQVQAHLSAGGRVIFSAVGVVAGEPPEASYSARLAAGPESIDVHIVFAGDSAYVDTVEGKLLVDPADPLLAPLLPMRDPLAFWRAVVGSARSLRRLPAEEGVLRFLVTPDWKQLQGAGLGNVESGTVTLVLERGSLWLRQAEADVQAPQPMRLTMRVDQVNVAAMGPKVRS